jgi:hypothetical protein
MRTCLLLFVMLAITAIVCAADSPNAPPLPPKGVKSIEKMGVGHGSERMAQGRGEIRERFAEHHEEYIKWLEKNYPDEAKQLAQVKEENPERYLHLLNESFEKYGRLARADKNNPELAKLLRQDIDLKAQTQKTLDQIHAATDEKQKSKLTDELQQLVSKRFDLIVAQKQIRYQQLNKKLEDLKKEIKKHESDLEKLRSKKNEEVKKRVDELLNKTEGINWD